MGLLQLMLQSSMLIPVHEKSYSCLFDQILTDIGDNQSIENHLSTYSYRLKNMKSFLKKCNSNTLFLKIQDPLVFPIFSPTVNSSAVCEINILFGCFK